MTATIGGREMSATRVYDLADASSTRQVRRRGMDLGGPIAAVFGGVALGAAVAPGLPADARWSLVVGSGAIGLLVGLSTIRRRQALLSLLLAFAGLAAPLAAGAITTIVTTAAPPPVATEVVPDRALAVPGDALTSSAAFAGLTRHDRADAEAFATALVLRLRTLHGSFGPYPASLRLSDGSVVEGAGLLEGTALGVVPADARLEYRVTRSGSAFRVVVVSTEDPAATVAADSSLMVPGG